MPKYLKIKGSIGNAHIIDTMPVEYQNILNRLIPQSFGGNGTWHMYYFQHYFKLKNTLVLLDNASEPEELELYLLDFKLGGVEFNRYAEAKHVHALLVDNSDQQVTLEILRELREKMTERGKQLRNAGYNNIKEYLSFLRLFQACQQKPHG